MIEAFVDPYIFSCPAPDEGSQAFIRYIDDIISWQDLTEANWLNLYLPGSASETLFDSGTYPLWNDLKELITKYDIEYVQARDVMTIIDGLLTKTATFEEKFFFKEALFENGVYDPSYHVECRTPMFVESYASTVVIISLIIQCRNLESQNTVLITRRLNNEKEDTKVSSTIQECDYSDCSQVPDYPFELNGEFLLCNSPQALISAVNPNKVLASAKNINDVNNAGSIYLDKYIKENGLNKNAKDYLWTFHSEFFRTIKATGFLHEETKIKMLLKTCAETILGESMISVHALRESSKGGSKQRIRDDKAKACRRDVDREYHLHYWQTSNGPELASVGVHDNMYIPK